MKESTDVERLIRAQDWVYEEAGARWQDGLILGNGDLGVIGYAPYGLEWILNKVDIFDGRVSPIKQTPHRQVMERFFKEHHTTVTFLKEWEAHPVNPKPPQVVAQTAGVMRLCFGPDGGWCAPSPHRVRQRLCLWEGELYYELDAHLSHPRLRCFVPRNRNLFCLRLENIGCSDWEHFVELWRPQDDYLKNPEWETGSGSLVLKQIMPHGDAGYAIALRVVPRQESKTEGLFSRYNDPGSIKPRVETGEHSKFFAGIQQSGCADIFVSIHTSYESPDPVKSALAEVKKAAVLTFPGLERENQRWWKNYWQKGWADFGRHNEIQKYWTFGLYETACNYGKAPVPGLSGLWYGPTRAPRSGVGCGASTYFHDQNIQIPAMPFFATNRSEFVIPFADTYLNVLPELKRHTRRLFGRQGVCLPLMMNQLGKDVPAKEYRYTLCGSAYSGIILVWAWRYTRDKKLLKEKLYPLLREFVRYYADAMTLGADGRYHLDWSIPPEIFTMTRDDTATLGMLKPCLETAIEAGELFRCDASERKQWQDILLHYPEIAIQSRGGFWGGPDIPDDHYCHGAHLLYPFFPGESMIDKAGKKIAARTVDYIENYSIDRSYADVAGRWHHKYCWSWLLTTVTIMRLGRREKGWPALYDFLRLFAKPNGLFAHNPAMVIDPKITETNLKNMPARTIRSWNGNLGNLAGWVSTDHGWATSLNSNIKRLVTPAKEGNGAFLFAATEALLQSYGGIIRLFPGVPAGFSGQFHHFLAQGGFEVSAEMRNGKALWVQIKGRVAGTACLLNPWKNKIPKLPSGSQICRQDDGTILAIKIKHGQVWLLH